MKRAIVTTIIAFVVACTFNVVCAAPSNQSSNISLDHNLAQQLLKALNHDGKGAAEHTDESASDNASFQQQNMVLSNLLMAQLLKKMYEKKNDEASARSTGSIWNKISTDLKKELYEKTRWMMSKGLVYGGVAIIVYAFAKKIPGLSWIVSQAEKSLDDFLNPPSRLPMPFFSGAWWLRGRWFSVN